MIRIKKIIITLKLPPVALSIVSSGTNEESNYSLMKVGGKSVHQQKFKDMKEN